jgi:hypothetical protein
MVVKVLYWLQRRNLDAYRKENHKLKFSAFRVSCPRNDVLRAFSLSPVPLLFH